MPKDPAIEAIARAAQSMRRSALKSVPSNVDDWTTDDMLIAQNCLQLELEGSEARLEENTEKIREIKGEGE